MIDDEKLNENEPIQPIPGQMCYDEILLPEREEEEEKQDASVAVGQIDIWNLPPQPVEKVNVKKDEETKQEAVCEFTAHDVASVSEGLDNNCVQNDINKESVIDDGNFQNKSLEEENLCCSPKIELIGNENNREENDDSEKDVFQSPKKLRKLSVPKKDFAEVEKIEESPELNETREEGVEVLDEEEKMSSLEEENLTVDFENPPKKLEKSEINASKMHFFGNYENPFDE